MAGFEQATAVWNDGVHDQALIDSDWFIWGPFGGYLAALAMRAMAGRSAFGRPATFSCQYLNVGKAGAACVAVEILKHGRSAECLRASVSQDGRPLLEAQAWIVADQLSGIEHDDAPSPAACSPDSLADWHGFGDESKSPIWHHIQRRPLPEFRSAPQSAGLPRWTCWLKLRDILPAGDPALQAARAILWMDLAPWNAALNAHGWPTTHLAPTLDLTVQFQPDLYAAEMNTADWMLVETASPQASAGLFGANTRLSSASGKLLAIGAAQGLCVPNRRYVEQISRQHAVKP